MSVDDEEADSPTGEFSQDPGPWIPYGRHTIEPEDLDAVAEALFSGFLTTGPKVEEFESAVSEYVGVDHAIAVNSGTAALHTMLCGFGIGPGDEVVVPAITFAATATAVVHAGAIPVFADVDPGTALVGAEQVERVLSDRTRAVIAVDFAGQPCDYAALKELLEPRNIRLFADGCHALGGSLRGQKVGSLADATTFSFHPVKNITTAEGGMVVTSSGDAAERMRRFRNHGITVTHSERERSGEWFYEIPDIGMNYRLSDLQCALGVSQLRRLDRWVSARQQLARRYDLCLADLAGVQPLLPRSDIEHAYHLYVVRIDPVVAGFDRNTAFHRLREQQIGVNVHYIPVHLHPYFRRAWGTGPGQCPQAEAYYEQALTLPLYPSMGSEEIKRVIDVLSDLQLL